MGNLLCCPPAKLCDHTVDEVQGLLNSSDSKASAKAEGNEEAVVSPVLAVNESSKNEEHVTQEEDGVTTQPMASPKSSGSHVAQSSYSAIIPILHTETSLAAQVSQSASPISKAQEKVVWAAVTAVEDAGTKNDDGNFQALATNANDDQPDLGEEPIVFDTAVAEKTETQITNVLIEKDEAAKPVQAASAEVPAEEINLCEDTQKGTVELVREIVTNTNALEEDIENKKPKTPAVLDEKHITQNEVPTMDASTIDKPEAEGLLRTAETKQTSLDTLVSDNDLVEPLLSSSGLDIVDKTPTVVISEEPISMLTDEVDELRQDASKIAKTKEDLPSETQEPSEQVPSPSQCESTAHKLENGKVNDMGNSKDNASPDVADVPKEAGISQETSEEPPLIETEEEMWSELPTEDNSGASTAEAVVKSDSTATSEAQKTVTEGIKNEGQDTETLLNGLGSPGPVEKPESIEASDAQPDDTESEIKATDLSSAVLLDNNQKEAEFEEAPAPSESEQEAITEEKEVPERAQAHNGESISSSFATQISHTTVNEIESVAEKEQVQDDQDLYRGDDEIEKEQPKETQSKPLLEFTLPGVEKCSLAPAVDILAYSEREWKGNTAKSTLIRKGYSEMSCSFTGLRRVRGDNYCSLRATLYQVLATTVHTPEWLLEEDFTSLPEKLAAQEQLIETWLFPPECNKAEEKTDAVEKLKHYMEVLQKRWQEAAESKSLEEKQRICESIFQCGEEEYGLLEVLKLLMLAKAVELHGKMQEGQEVPVFCWLLFARDTSENPITFFSNHLSQMGFSGGLEQVEMFLLGYALQHTIQAFRLYKIDTEEFVTHYPDDHKQDWPCVCIVTEDDRHYNVPVRKQEPCRD